VLGGIELGSVWQDTAMTPVFFRRIQITDIIFMCQNEKFSYRFFPPAIGRIALPVRFAAEKAAPLAPDFLVWRIRRHWRPRSNLWRWPILGSITAANVIPERDFQVVCVAMTAIDSSTILPIARECARIRAICGSFTWATMRWCGPFGAETSYGLRAPIWA